MSKTLNHTTANKNNIFLLYYRMTDQKFKESCIRFKKTIQNENSKRRRLIEIDTPNHIPKVEVTSIETNLPKLKIDDLIDVPKQEVDILKELVLELAIDQDDENMINREVAQEVLPKIQCIQPGRRTRFRVDGNYGPVEVYIRRSLAVWLVFEGTKLIFPKPRNDVSMEAAVP